MVSYVMKWNSVCDFVLDFNTHYICNYNYLHVYFQTNTCTCTKFPYILLNYALNINKINTVNSRSPLSCQTAILSNSLFDCHSTDQNYKIMDNNGFLTVNAYTD